jgi:hypothetical protein
MPTFAQALAAMREAMERNPHWCRVVGTPLENDLPVIAADMAMRWLRAAERGAGGGG